MARSDRYDHVLSEEFDDYEDRRRCGACRARGSPPSAARPAETPPPSSGDTGTVAFNCVLFALMVSAMLAVGVLVATMLGSHYFRAKGDASNVFSGISAPAIGCPARPRNCETMTADWLAQRRRKNRNRCRKQRCCKKQKNPAHPLELVVRRLLRFLRFTK